MPTPTVADEAARIIQAKADIKAAIEAKGVTVPSSALIDTYDGYVTAIQQGGSPNLTTLQVTPTTQAQVITPTSPVDGYNEVDVVAVTSAIDSNITAGNIKKDVSILGVTGTYEGGSTPTEEKTVRFRDYDGTLLYEYTPTEFAALSAMPANPTHTGLTAQGWNWSLADAKTYVAKYKALIIGQMYITDDNKTRIYITIDDTLLLDVQLYFYQSTANGVSIDWGDGSTAETVSGTGNKNVTHTYAATGSYVIALTVSSGTAKLGYSQSCCLINSIGTSSSSRYGYDGAKRLNKVEIGSNITEISGYAFQYTNLSSITIPTGVAFANYAFALTYYLDYVTAPSGITSVGDYTFNNSKLSGISLSRDITTLGTYVFQYCNVLEKITIPDSVTSIGNSLFYGAYSLESITIPSSVTSIGTYVFRECHGLKSADLSNLTITSLPSGIFYECRALSEVKLPSTITSIGSYAFYYCYGLHSIELPSTLTSIGSNAFDYCRCLSHISIPSSVTSIGSYAFESCTSLQEIVLPSNLNNLGSYAFNGCSSLRSPITIPEYIAALPDYVFTGCTALQSVTLHEDCTTFGTYVFRNCSSLRSINIQSGTTVLNNYMLNGCYSLSEVIIPEGVTTINTYALSSLCVKSLTIPSSVTSIAAYAFDGNANTKEYHFLSTTPPTLANKNAFNSIASDCVIYVPAASLSQYQSASQWNNSTIKSKLVGE